MLPVILLLLNHCLVLLSLCVGDLWSFFCSHLDGEERAGYFNTIVFLVSSLVDALM